MAAERTTKVHGDVCLHTIFEQQAARQPQRIALRLDDRQLTYGELNSRANQLAQVLRRLGVGPETLVGLYTERSLEMIVGLIAILKAGGAYLPIDTMYPKDRISFMLQDAQVSVLLTQHELQASVAETEAHVICLDTEWEAIAQESTDNLALEISSQNLAYVIYTSGSTGMPKGCLITHHNAVRLMQSSEHWYGFNENDIVTLFHSHAFDFSVWEMWSALHYGGQLVLVPYGVSRSPETFLQLLRDRRVTVLNQTPSAFRQLQHADELAGETGLALRLIILGGETLDFPSLGPWFDKHGDQQPHVINTYGITETTVLATYRRVRREDTINNEGSKVGVPIPDLQLHILDEQMQPTATGNAGEIYVGGEGVGRGYLNRRELTQARFIDDPFSSETGRRLYRSGDLARRVADGDIEYLGRIDQQVKIRGFRIELGEIEVAVRQHPGVRDAAVLLDETGEDKRLVAYIVPGAVTPSASELRTFLSSSLPDYMLPALFVTLEKLPLTAHGKLDRKALPAAVAPDAGSTPRVAHRSAVEEEIATIWKECLGIDGVGVDENFFDIGGHSLSAMRVVVRLRSVFDVDISVADLFQHSTIESLAVAIEAMRLEAHSDEELLRMLAEIEEAGTESQSTLDVK
ncbi:MAG: amino acid adenylation domain-containing protein [Acidobacteriota bacterium]